MSFQPGQRVRLRTWSHVLALRAATGIVIGPADYDDYYIIELDEPAIYRSNAGWTQELSRIVEAADNMAAEPS